MNRQSTAILARQVGEKVVVKELVEYLGKHGWHAVAVDSGGGEPDIEAKYSVGLSAAQVIEHVFAVDVAYVYFSNGVKGKHWVLFVLGNSPEEVISDWTYSPDDDFEFLMKEFEAAQVYEGWLNKLISEVKL